MPSSEPPALLSADEIASLRDCIEGRAGIPAACEAFASRGLLQREDGGHYVLTDAARKMVDLAGPWTEPGAEAG